MGNRQDLCVCSDIFKNILIDSANFVDITKLEECKYDNKKIIRIQSNFRRYLVSKTVDRTTIHSQINKEKQNEDINQ